MIREAYVLLCVALFLPGVTAGCGEDSDTAFQDTEGDSDTSIDTESGSINDALFYLEHLKQDPAPPECAVVADDPAVDRMAVDLAYAGNVVLVASVVNNMPNEGDDSELAAESNGVFVDGYDVTIFLPSGEQIGETVSVDSNVYIEPEQKSLMGVSLLPGAIVESLRSSFGCGGVTYESIQSLSQELASSLDNGESFSGEVPTMGPAPFTEPAVSEIIFYGHTQGGKPLTSPTFTMEIQLYCGPSNGFEPCTEDICATLCAPPIETCSMGVYAPLTCARYLGNPSLCATHCM